MDLQLGRRILDHRMEELERLRPGDHSRARQGLTKRDWQLTVKRYFKIYVLLGGT